jgi:hypothetical protein
LGWPERAILSAVLGNDPRGRSDVTLIAEPSGTAEMECIPQTLTAPSLGADLEGERREPCLIQAKVVEGVFSGPQKRQIVEGLAETIVSIGGENIRQVTWGLG